MRIGSGQSLLPAQYPLTTMKGSLSCTLYIGHTIQPRGLVDINRDMWMNVRNVYPQAPFFICYGRALRSLAFWEQVIKFLNDEMDSPIPLCPNACILLPDPETFDPHYSYSFCVQSVY